MERIDKLKEFLAASPDDSFLQHALALEYIKMGNEEEARKLFIEIVLREPTYVGTYYHLAKLYERIGDNEKAIKIYEKGMEMAKVTGDTHSFNELRAAHEELVFD